MNHMNRILKQACERGTRAVILIPEAAYEEALKFFACKFEKNAGRTARMPGGNLLTVITPQTSADEIPGEFDLYLSGWGKATPKDEREVSKWMSRAREVYTEIS